MLKFKKLRTIIVYNVKYFFNINCLLRISILLVIVASTGCSRQSRKTILSFQTRQPDVVEIKENVTLNVKLLSKKEFNSVFHLASSSKRRAFFKDYVFLKMNILNNSNDELFLNKDSVVSIPRNYVFDRLNHSHGRSLTAARVVRNVGVGTVAIALASIANIHFRPSSGNWRNGLAEAGLIIIIGAVVVIPSIIIIGISLLSNIIIKKNRISKNKKLDNFIEETFLDPNNEYRVGLKDEFNKIYIVKKTDLQSGHFIRFFNKKNDSYLEFTVQIN